MGMYDVVDFDTKCPNCQHPVTGFQTKSRDCVLECISPVGLEEFYSECDHCKTWLIYRWDHVSAAPVLNLEKMFMDLADNVRSQREQIFALCGLLGVYTRDMFGQVNPANAHGIHDCDGCCSPN